MKEISDFDEKKDYEVVLSFAGEKRDYVEKVARFLKNNNVKVFYDNFDDMKTYLWGKELPETFEEIYGGNARYCVMFISKEYANKMWTNEERKSALSKAIKEKSEYILPARFDDTKIPGIRDTVGYIDLQKHKPDDLGKLILEKLGVSVEQKPDIISKSESAVDEIKKIDYIKIINKRTQMRDYFKKVLYNKFDPKKPTIGFHRFNCDKVNIQKFDYSYEQKNIPDEYGWYKAISGEPYNITDEGLVLVIGLDEGYVKDNTFYKNVNDNYPENIKLSKYFKFGLLSYDNILTYDMNNDEHRPIMYCKYDGKLGPFKKVYYSLTENFK